MVNSAQDLQLTGLSDQEVADRLQQNGYNELPSTHQRSFLAIAWEIVQEPIFLLLIGCGVIYLQGKRI